MTAGTPPALPQTSTTPPRLPVSFVGRERGAVGVRPRGPCRRRCGGRGWGGEGGGGCGSGGGAGVGEGGGQGGEEGQGEGGEKEGRRGAEGEAADDVGGVVDTQVDPAEALGEGEQYGHDAHLAADHEEADRHRRGQRGVVADEGVVGRAVHQDVEPSWSTNGRGRWTSARIGRLSSSAIRPRGPTTGRRRRRRGRPGSGGPPATSTHRPAARMRATSPYSPMNSTARSTPRGACLARSLMSRSRLMSGFALSLATSAIAWCPLPSN